MSLTDKQISSLKPKEKQYKKSDGDGLYILVKPTGGKYWRLAFRVKNAGKVKQKELALGVYPDVTLKQARQKRIEALNLLAQGIDPCEQRRAEKNVDHLSDTFEAIAREWFELQKGNWTKNYSDDVIQRLSRNVFPCIGDMLIADIKPSDVLNMLRGIEARGNGYTAHRLKQLCNKVFRYAVITERIESDPSRDLTDALAPVKATHHPTILEPQKISQLIQLINSYEAYYTVSHALRLLPLVCVRQSELRLAEWSEINFEQKIWTIPGSKMKMRNDHIVPLSLQALAILLEIKSIRALQRHSASKALKEPEGFIFHSVRTQTRPISDGTLGSALKILGYDNTQIVPHGFRAMFRTLLEEQLGFPPHWIDMQLAHQVHDANGRAYNRTQLLEQRTFMMQVWADWLQWISEDGYCTDDHRWFRLCVRRYLYSKEFEEL